MHTGVTLATAGAEGQAVFTPCCDGKFGWQVVREDKSRTGGVSC